jgi:hypothetical protein
VIAGVLVALTAASPLLVPGLFRLPLLPGLKVLATRLAEQPELRAVNVFAFHGRDAVGLRQQLLIQATVARPLEDNVPLSTRLAGIALASDPDAAMQDLISVRLAHGYDIGIAASWTTQQLALRPEQWADRVQAGVAN